MNRTSRPNERPPSLDELFAPYEEQLLAELRDFLSGQGEDEERFRRRCVQWINDRVDAFVLRTQVWFKETGRLWWERLHLIRRELADHRSLLGHLERQTAERMTESAPSGIVVLGCGVVYALLVLAAMGIFAYTFGFIYPDQASWIGALSALVLTAPSYLLSHAYHCRSVAGRERLMRCLLRAGIGSAGALIFSFQVARWLTYRVGLTGGASSASSFTPNSFFNPGSSDWALTLLLGSSFLGLIAISAVEVCFTSTLAVQISHYFAASRPSDLIASQIAHTRAHITSLEEAEERVIELLGHLAMEDRTWEVWGRGKKVALSLRIDALLAQYRDTLIRQIVTHVGTVPVAVLQTMATVITNGKGGEQYEKRDHRLVAAL